MKLNYTNILAVLFFLSGCFSSQKNEYSKLIEIKEDKIVLSYLPSKFEHYIDSNLIFKVGSKINRISLTSGNLSELIDCNKINADSLLKVIYNIDTLAISKDIKEYNCPKLKPKVSISNFTVDKSNSIKIIGCLTYTTFKLNTSLGDSVVNAIGYFKRLAITLDSNLQINSIQNIEEMNDLNDRVAIIPEVGVFCNENKLFIGNDSPMSDSVNYQIYDVFDLTSMEYQNAFPIFVNRKTRKDIKSFGTSMMRNFTTMRFKDSLLFENDQCIFNMSSNNDTCINLSEYLNDNFYINNFLYLGKNKWVIEIITSNSKSIYLIDHSRKAIHKILSNLVEFSYCIDSKGNNCYFIFSKKDKNFVQQLNLNTL